MRFLYAFLMLFYVASLEAGSRGCSLWLSEKLMPIASLTPVLTPSRIQEVKALLDKNPQNTLDLFDQVFHILVEARAESFSDPRLRESFLASEKILRPRFWDDNKMRAQHTGIVLNLGLKDNPVTLGLRSHELSHREDETSIQKNRAAAALLKTIRTVVDPTLIIKDEKKAIFAEWEILREIPREMRVQAYKDLNLSKLDPYDIELFRSMLLDVDKPFEEYLAIQYSNERYSIGHVSIKYIRNMVLLGALAASCGVMIAGSSAVFNWLGCAVMTAQSNTHQDSLAFIRRFCD